MHVYLTHQKKKGKKNHGNTFIADLIGIKFKTSTAIYKLTRRLPSFHDKD